MENTILRKFKENQNSRIGKRNENKGKSFSQRFKNKANQRGFAYGNVVRKLVDTLEATFDDDTSYTSDDEVLDIVDDSDDQFHDSAQSPGGPE